MDDGFREVDAFVSKVKSNTNFLKKLFFPRVLLIVSIGILVIAIAIRLILI